MTNQIEIIRTYKTSNGIVGAVYTYMGRKCSTFLGRVKDATQALFAMFGAQEPARMDPSDYGDTDTEGLAEDLADNLEEVFEQTTNSDRGTEARAWNNYGKTRIYITHHGRDRGYIGIYPGDESPRLFASLKGSTAGFARKVVEDLGLAFEN